MQRYKPLVLLIFYYGISTLCIALSLASDQEKLLKEVTTMLSFEHPNVMSLIGVCIDGEMPLIIMPYMSKGSVLGYVKRNKEELYFQIDRKLNQEEVHRHFNAEFHINAIVIILSKLGRSCEKGISGCVLSDQ